MELLELVENEPTARPFQCDWQPCDKVRKVVNSIWKSRAYTYTELQSQVGLTETLSNPYE